MNKMQTQLELQQIQLQIQLYKSILIKKISILCTKQ
jgi:hypothetical protein